MWYIKKTSTVYITTQTRQFVFLLFCLCIFFDATIFYLVNVVTCQKCCDFKSRESRIVLLLEKKSTTATAKLSWLFPIQSYISLCGLSYQKKVFWALSHDTLNNKTWHTDNNFILQNKTKYNQYSLNYTWKIIYYDYNCMPKKWC